MSYCRFSSDDFRSDLYIYADVSGGWTIHVAGNRVVGNIPKQDTSTSAKWVKTRKAQMDFLGTAKRKPIDLPHAGKTFSVATAGECADKVEQLLALGYRCPDGVVEALRTDEAEGGYENG